MSRPSGDLTRAAAPPIAEIREDQVGEDEAPPSPLEIVDEYEALEVSRHPFFVRLAEGSVNLGAIWLLMANLDQGISGHFVHWLARTIARTDDKKMACFLAKQLNDELGNGDVQQIHSILLDRFIAGLEPWRPKNESRDALLEAGRRLAVIGARPFFTDALYEAIGALMVGEIFAKKMDHSVGDHMRRQDALSERDMRWLTLHETLEMDHADDSRELALLVPDRPRDHAAVLRGARSQWHALWSFLSDVDGALTRLR